MNGLRSSGALIRAAAVTLMIGTAYTPAFADLSRCQRQARVSCLADLDGYATFNQCYNAEVAICEAAEPEPPTVPDDPDACFPGYDPRYEAC